MDLFFHEGDLIEFYSTVRRTTDEHYWLVGDNGVYFCTESLNPNNPESGRFVVFAENCNPEAMEFDEWWEVKQATWGGDDGVEKFHISELEKALTTIKHLRSAHKDRGHNYLRVHCTPNSLNFAVIHKEERMR